MPARHRLIAVSVDVRRPARTADRRRAVRLERPRGRVLPARRQRRLRRRPLHPAPGLRPGDRRARRPRHRPRHRDGGAQPLQPRLPRLRHPRARASTTRRPRSLRDGQELMITPRRPLRPGGEFEVNVKYRGVPAVIVDPDNSIEGWIPTDDGAFVVNEPQGSPGWFPANDNPRDKATFDFRVTVPRGKVALANGVLKSSQVGRHPHDLALEPGRADGAVPRPRPPTATSRRASPRSRTACRSTSPSTGRSARARTSRASRRRSSSSRETYGAVPVLRGGRHRRQRRLRRLRARDPDQGQLRERARARARSSTRSRTSGSATR